MAVMMYKENRFYRTGMLITSEISPGPMRLTRKTFFGVVGANILSSRMEEGGDPDILLLNLDLVDDLIPYFLM
jgi:hypothetical protein